MKIGFIGLGTMGKGMVKNLLKKDYEVIAYNRTRDKGLDINKDNFSMVDHPKDVCNRSSLIFTCVSNDEALEAVLFGANGVFEEIKENQILVDCSTTSVEMTEKIAQECDDKGIMFLDAPITGSKLGAEGGTLMFMVGGKKKILDDSMNVFESMGKRIVYCGENTMGQRAKIALNLTQALILESYFEGVMLAMKNGVSIEAIREILDNSGAKNAAAGFKMPYVEKRDFQEHFKLSLMRKDLHLADSEIEKLGLDLPLSKQISNIYDLAAEKGLGKDDFISTVKIIEGKNNLVLAPSKDSPHDISPNCNTKYN